MHRQGRNPPTMTRRLTLLNSGPSRSRLPFIQEEEEKGIIYPKSLKPIATNSKVGFNLRRVISNPLVESAFASGVPSRPEPLSEYFIFPLSSRARQLEVR